MNAPPPASRSLRDKQDRFESAFDSNPKTDFNLVSSPFSLLNCPPFSIFSHFHQFLLTVELSLSSHPHFHIRIPLSLLSVLFPRVTSGILGGA